MAAYIKLGKYIINAEYIAAVEFVEIAAREKSYANVFLPLALGTAGPVGPVVPARIKVMKNTNDYAEVLNWVGRNSAPA